MEQLVLPLYRDVNIFIEDALISDSNKIIVEWIKFWPSWNRYLVIYGDHGCGKTCIAHFLANNYNFILADSYDIATIYNDVLNQADGIIIDDAHIYDEKKLLCLINIVRERGKKIIIISPAPPSYWKVEINDLQSRLKAMPIVKIDQPDDQLLKILIKRLFSSKQIVIDDNIVDFLINRIERNIFYVQNIIKAIDEISLRDHKKITISFVKQVIAQYNKKLSR